MSRNKDIKMLHDFTGCDYSVLRKALKANKWDLWKAECSVKGIDPDAIFELGRKCGEFVRQLSEALKPSIEAIGKAAATMAEAVKNQTFEGGAKS
jgi:hypothetical protein